MRFRSTGTLSALLALLAVAVYLPALGNDFVNWDDPLYVKENALSRGFSLEALGRVFTEPMAFNYHPLTIISHGLDHAIWGGSPMGHHLTSLLLHGLNTALVFLLLIRLFPVQGSPGEAAGRVSAAALAALLFGVHPIHVESVAWVSERKDVLYAAFYLLSLLAYIRYARSQQGGRAFYLSSVLCHLFSLMSKSMAVTLPAVLLLLDIWPLERLKGGEGRLSGVRKAIVEKIPYFVLSVFFSLATLWAQERSVLDLPLGVRLGHAGYALMLQTVRLFVPIHLSPYYPYPHPAFSRLTVPVWMLAASVSAVAAVTWYGFRLRRRRPELWIAWGSYALQLVPVLGVVQVGTQLTADRYAYLPSVPVFFLVATAGVSFLAGRGAWFRWGGLFLAVCVSGLLIRLTLLQIPVWRDSISLWTHAIDRYPGLSALPYFNRGCAFLEIGANGKALRDFDQAIELDPFYAEAYNNRGYVYMGYGFQEKALRDFDRALEIDPENGDAFGNRGTLFLYRQAYPEALRDLTRALEIDPANFKARRNRGRVLLALRRHQEAVRDLTEALAHEPDHAESYLDRGRAREALGDVAAAVEDYKRALELNPDLTEAHAALGAAYSRLGPEGR